VCKHGENTIYANKGRTLLALGVSVVAVLTLKTEKDESAEKPTQN